METEFESFMHTSVAIPDGIFDKSTAIFKNNV